VWSDEEGERGRERGNILRKALEEQWWERNEESHLIGLWLTTYNVCSCLFCFCFFLLSLC
jgi:hypothetical protein